MTYKIIIIGVWLAYCVLNVCIAEWNDSTRRKRIKAKDPRQINHPLWAAIYCLLIAVPGFIFKDWYLIGSLALLHISVFPVFYNIFSDNPTFNLSKTSTALSDRFMVWAGLKSTEAVNLLSLALSIFLLIKSL